MTSVLQAIEESYQRRQAWRPVGWEDALRRWRVRRNIKKHRVAEREGNEDEAKHALNRYGRSADKVAELMRKDPLHLGRGGGGGARQKKFSSQNQQFTWCDMDTAVQPDLFIPQELENSLENAEAAETSGDRRKRAIAESRMKSEKFAEDRRTKRRKVLETLTDTKITERAEEEIMSHDWESYKTSLKEQKKAVEEQAAQLKINANARDRFADILSDSD